MPPRIIYEGDEDAARRHLPVAQNLLHKVRIRAAASGSAVTGQSLAPDDNSFIYALKIGDTEVLHIFSQPRVQHELVPREFTQLPDFLNGVTKSGRIVERTVPDPEAPGGERVVELFSAFKPTPETAMRYDWGLGFRELRRLTVKPWVAFSLGTVQDGSTQYEFIYPSMYSGRMRKLVQVVLGFGRLPPHMISEQGPDRADLMRHGIRVRFDHRWHRTHNLYRGPDGTQWLVEVSLIKGVLAMQLPVYPDSAGIATSRWPSLRECGLEFGGLPTGLGFPTHDRLQRLIDSGHVLQLLTPEEMEPFYELQPFSTGMGWTFNETGTEAHNTGWRWGVDGIRVACHYTLNLTIGALKQNRQKGEPIADATAVLTLNNEGQFYDPAPITPPAIKFHEPLVGGLVSVDMTAANGREVSPQELPGMDTTLHVAFIENRLATVRYYWNRIEKLDDPKIEDSSEDCMYVGSWQRRVENSPSNSIFRFYTTFDDQRETFYSMESTTTWDSTDQGWLSYHIDDDLSDPFFAMAFRKRMFRKRTRFEQIQARNGFNAIIIPGNVRDAFAYYYYKGHAGGYRDESVEYPLLTDPNIYRTVRRLFVEVHGQCPPKFCITRGGNGCACCADPKYHTVSFNIANSLTGPGWACNFEYANEGEWLDPCQQLMPIVSRTAPLPYSLPRVTIPPEDVVRAVLYSDSGYGALRIAESPSSRFLWRARSPNEEGIYQTMYCSYNSFGDEHIAYGDNINVGINQRKGWMLDPLDNSQQNVNFLGYISREKPPE
jgi:hypothetical protein